MHVGDPNWHEVTWEPQSTRSVLSVSMKQLIIPSEEEGAEADKKSHHNMQKNWQIILYLFAMFVCNKRHKTTLISSTVFVFFPLRTQKLLQNVIFCNKFEWFSTICFSLSFPDFCFAFAFFLWAQQSTQRTAIDWSIWNGKKCPLLGAQCVSMFWHFSFLKDDREEIRKIIDGH